MTSSVTAETGTGQLPTLKIVTEGLVPVSYKDPMTGNLEGFATDYIKELMSHTDINYQFNVYPWSRTYRMGMTRPNVLVVAIARTQSREEQFIWFEKIFSLKTYLFGLEKRKNEIISEDKHYLNSRIGIVRNDFVHETVVEKGFTNIIAVENQWALSQLLLKERVDFIISSPFALDNFDIGTFLKDAKLFKAQPLEYLHNDIYYAFSQGTDERIIQQMTTASVKLKTENKQSTAR